jgi:dipeptidyl aminopeptidase/acylaminoacyl peptidase
MQPGLSESQIRLTTECDARHHCHGVVIDQHSGDRHNVDLALSNVSPWLAATSPDGQYLAVVYAAAHHPIALHLLDLRRGHDRLTTVQVDQTLHEGSAAWSPDSDYLFVAGVKGRLWVINSATGVVSEFPARLPPVRQLAARPVSR